MISLHNFSGLALLTTLAALSSGCTAPTQAQNPPLETNKTAKADDRVADVVVNTIDAPAGVLRQRGFAIDAPTDIEPLAPKFPVPAGAIRVRAGDDLKAAINKARDGDTVVVGAGTYRVGEINVEGRKLTIQNAPGEKVWLSGCALVKGWNEQNGVWVASWDKWFGRAKNIDDAYLDLPNFPMAAEREMVFADGVPLFQVGARDKVGPGQFFADKEKNQLVIGVDPNGREIEATQYEKGLGFYSPGNVLRGIGFKGYADWGFNGKADDLTLDSNTFAWNAQAGFKFSQNTGAPILIKNNLCIANGRKGGDLVRTRGAILENNRFSYNNVEGFRIQWDAAGVKVLEAADVIARGNVVDNNNSMGLWLDVDCDNATYQRNVAFKNRSVGIFFEVSKGALLENNVAYENGTGIQIANASGATVRGNRLWNNTAGWVVKWTKRKTLNPNDGDAIYDAKDNLFENNVVALTKTMEGAHLVDMSNVQGEAATAHVTARNNTYVLAAGVKQTPFLWSVPGAWNKPFDDLKSLQTEGGGETGSRLLTDQTVKVGEKNGVQTLEIAGLNP